MKKTSKMSVVRNEEHDELINTSASQVNTSRVDTVSADITSTSRESTTSFSNFTSLTDLCRKVPSVQYLLEEWHTEYNSDPERNPDHNQIILPTNILPTDSRPVWWKCRKGHAWQESVANRVTAALNGTDKGCIFCKPEKIERAKVLGDYCTGSVPIGEVDCTTTTPATPGTLTTSESREQTIWDTLFAAIGNAFGVAGLMGNLYAESTLNPQNLQNNGNNKLGMTDAEFTTAFDSGKYTVDTFIHDGYGYGLAQWTYYSRKQALLNYAKAAGKSIGDLTMQLGFLLQEIKGYKTVWNTICNAKSVREASDVVLLKYECPADQSEAVQIKRAGYGQKYYDKYAKAISVTPTAPVTPTTPTTPTTSTVTVTTKYYRVRKSWVDKASQIGAYTVFQNAKNTVDANPGYAAFADDGTQVYPAVEQTPSADQSDPCVPYLVRITNKKLNYRKGPDVSYDTYGYIKPGIYTIVEEQNGWGLLKGYAKYRNGWVCLKYTEKMKG